MSVKMCVCRGFESVRIGPNKYRPFLQSIAEGLVFYDKKTGSKSEGMPLILTHILMALVISRFPA